MDRLAHKWDARLATLERLQLQLSETPRTRARKVAKLRDRIGGLQREVTQLQVLRRWGVGGVRAGVALPPAVVGDERCCPPRLF